MSPEQLLKRAVAATHSFTIVCYLTTSIAAIHFFYGAVIISREHLKRSIHYSKCITIVDIYTCKGDFGKSTFLKELFFQNTQFRLNFLSGFSSFWEQLLLNRIYLKHQIFVKAIYFFQSTTFNRYFMKQCVILFEEKSCGWPFIPSNVLASFGELG